MYVEKVQNIRGYTYISICVKDVSSLFQCKNK